MNRDSISLAGKVALVTGGGAGIGRAIVDACGALGATLVVADIDAAKVERVRNELAAAGVEALVCCTDVRDATQVGALVAETGFTRSMALELAPDNIRVNAIAPETTHSEQVPLDHILKQGRPGELLGKPAFLTRTLPSNRFGMPEDHAGAAVFLATDLAAWVNGTTVYVDGGGLAASGLQRIPSGEWTIIPEVSDKGTLT